MNGLYELGAAAVMTILIIGANWWTLRDPRWRRYHLQQETRNENLR